MPQTERLRCGDPFKLSSCNFGLWHPWISSLYSRNAKPRLSCLTLPLSLPRSVPAPPPACPDSANWCDRVINCPQRTVSFRRWQRGLRKVNTNPVFPLAQTVTIFPRCSAGQVSYQNVNRLKPSQRYQHTCVRNAKVTAAQRYLTPVHWSWLTPSHFSQSKRSWDLMLLILLVLLLMAFLAKKIIPVRTLNFQATPLGLTDYEHDQPLRWKVR